MKKKNDLSSACIYLSYSLLVFVDSKIILHFIVVIFLH